MELELKDKSKVNQLVTLFRHLKNLVNEVNINLSDKGMDINGMDSSHACLIDVNINATWFDKFKAESITLGVNCEILFKVIDCWKEGQTITMHTETADELLIDFEGKSTLDKRFTLPLIDIEADALTIPELEYQIDLGLKSHDFKELVSELAIFSESLKLTCIGEQITLLANGDMGKMLVEINGEDIIEYAVEEDCDLNINFGTNYVQQICSFCKLSSDVYIHCSSTKPLKFHYSLDDESSNNSKNYVRFFLATQFNDDI